jgi:hypothetical protein
VKLSEEQIREIYPPLEIVNSQASVSEAGRLELTFGRALYWPDSFFEVKLFMPGYHSVNPEIEALQKLKD